MRHTRKFFNINEGGPGGPPNWEPHGAAVGVSPNTTSRLSAGASVGDSTLFASFIGGLITANQATISARPTAAPAGTSSTGAPPPATSASPTSSAGPWTSPAPRDPWLQVAIAEALPGGDAISAVPAEQPLQERRVDPDQDPHGAEKQITLRSPRTTRRALARYLARSAGVREMAHTRYDLTESMKWQTLNASP